MYSRAEIEAKLEKLREQWKTAKETDRKIIEKRAIMLKIALTSKSLF